MKRKDVMMESWIVPDEEWTTFDNDNDWIVPSLGDDEEWTLPEWDLTEWGVTEWELPSWDLSEWDVPLWDV